MSQINVVKSWLDNVAYNHSGSHSTFYQFERALGLFCKFIGKTPEQILAEYESRDTDERLFKRRYAQFVQAWISSMNDGTYTAATISNRVTAVKSFFMYNDLPMGFLPHGNRAVVYHNRDIGKPEIQAVLAASKPRERAFFSFMVQSGLRPETVCMLQFKDLEPFDKNPCKVTVKKEKSKGHYADYFTFIAEDTIKHLEDYHSTRTKKTPEDFLFTNLNETGHLHRSHPSRYFQETASKLRTAGKVQYETKVQGKPSELRLYNLRKYFRKQASQAGGDFCNFWMGHALPQTSDKAYFPRDGGSKEIVEIHRKIYAEKAAPFLRLETSTPNETEKAIESQAVQIGLLKDEVSKLREYVNTVTSENLLLRTQSQSRVAQIIHPGSDLVEALTVELQALRKRLDMMEQKG